MVESRTARCFAVFAFAAFAATAQIAAGSLSFEGLKAPTLGTAIPQPLDRCLTAQCLTIYLAPWCPYCRASTPLILALREFLRMKGVATRVIVGLDKEGLV